MNRHVRSSAACAAVLGLFQLLWTAALAATPDSAPPRLTPVSEAMADLVRKQEISGAVTLVADSERILHLDATGLSDIAMNKAMAPDTVFWIASMTKPVTATAVLMLQEEGKLSLDDSIDKYIPELGKLKTADGKLPRITLRHLLTHTSGMGEITADQSKSVKDLAGLVPLYAAIPLQFAPGERWAYCQSSINTAARIVEIASGKAFEKFLEERLFGPLGMKDTTFYLSEEQDSRLARPYKRTETGKLELAQNLLLGDKSATSRDRFPAANGGLFSTAPDYVKFCRMILNGGSAGGKTYLKPESVRLMTTIQTGDLKTGFTEGNGWGIGWCVVRKPQGVTAMLSPGTHGHGGVYGTQAWIDPVQKRIYLLLVQRSNFPNADASDVRRVFQEKAAAALK